jgi:group I intron endonuclease
MAICLALSKHGYSNFSLEILEYCPASKLLKREKYYFKLLKPDYNISEEPSSPILGRNHSEQSRAKIAAKIAALVRSEETKAKLRGPKSEETKAKMSAAHKGKIHSEEHKEKISLAHPKCKKIEVNSLELNTSTIYNSMGEAAKSLNLSSHKIISQYISRKQLMPYKG